MKKWIISLLLSAIMLFSLLPVTAMAGEPSGRGETWDILYSEVRANGSGKAYPVGTRIYMDINPCFDRHEYGSLFMDSYDCAVCYGYVSGTYDSDLTSHYFEQEVELSNVLTLQEKYDKCSGYSSRNCSCENKPIKSGGYWIFNLDNGCGDEFYGVVSSGNGGSIPTSELDMGLQKEETFTLDEILEKVSEVSDTISNRDGETLDDYIAWYYGESSFSDFVDLLTGEQTPDFDVNGKVYTISFGETYIFTVTLNSDGDVTKVDFYDIDLEESSSFIDISAIELPGSEIIDLVDAVSDQLICTDEGWEGKSFEYRLDGETFRSKLSRDWSDSCTYEVSDDTHTWDLGGGNVFIVRFENEEVSTLTRTYFDWAYEEDVAEHYVYQEEQHSGAYEAFMELAKDFSDYACKTCRKPRDPSSIPYADFLQALDAITDCTKEYFTNSCTKNKGDFDRGIYHAYVGENEVRIRVNDDYKYYSVEFAPFHYYEYYDHLPELLEMSAEDLESLINTPVSEISEDDLWILEFVEGCEAARYAPDCTACEMVRDPKDVYNTWLIGKYNGGDKSKLVYVAPAGEANIENEEAFLAKLAQVWDGESKYEAEVDDTSVTFTFTDGENETVLKVMAKEEQHTTHDDIEYQAWTESTLPTTAGYYYLANDITLTANWTVPEGETYLCLNGKILTMVGYLIQVPANATLNLVDCGEDVHEGNINKYCWSLGEGAEGSTPKDIEGGIIYIPGDKRSINVYGTFNMFGGTITGFNGGNIHLIFNDFIKNSENKPIDYAGNFNMYGGAITGNNYTNGLYYVNHDSSFGVVDASKFESFTVGKDAVIDENYILGYELVEGSFVPVCFDGNVILSASKVIKIATGEYAPTSNMKIGVKTKTAPTKNKPIVFTDINAQTYISNFENNMPDMHIEVRNKNALYLCPEDVIEMHECVDHKEKQNGQAATCENDGWNDYYKCTECELLYSDDAMETEIEDLDAWKTGNGKIAKTGHLWGLITYTWNEDNTKCTAKRTCTHDSKHIENEEVTVTKTITQARTCENDELTTYTATFTNTAFVTQKNENVKTAEKLGHNYGSTTYEWSADHTSCTATRVCANDNTHKLTETKQATYVKDADATCVTTEKGHYTVTFDDSQFGSASISHSQEIACLTAHDIETIERFRNMLRVDGNVAKYVVKWIANGSFAEQFPLNFYYDEEIWAYAFTEDFEAENMEEVVAYTYLLYQALNYSFDYTFQNNIILEGSDTPGDTMRVFLDNAVAHRETMIYLIEAIYNGDLEGNIENEYQGANYYLIENYQWFTEALVEAFGEENVTDFYTSLHNDFLRKSQAVKEYKDFSFDYNTILKNFDKALFSWANFDADGLDEIYAEWLYDENQDAFFESFDISDESEIDGYIKKFIVYTFNVYLTKFNSCFGAENCTAQTIVEFINEFPPVFYEMLDWFDALYDEDYANMITLGQQIYGDTVSLFDKIFGELGLNIGVPAVYNAKIATMQAYDSAEITGHNYGTPTYSWNGDTCTATRTCANDPSHTLTETKKGTYVKDTNATCTTNEKGHYTVTFDDTQFGSASTTANSYEVANSLKAHSWNEEFTVDIEATLEHEGSKSIHCKNCDEVKDITVIDKKVPSKNTTDGEKVVVEIETENGFNPDLVLEVEVVVKADEVVIEDHEAIVEYKELTERFEKIAGVYDVRLLLNGAEIQPEALGEGTIVTVRMLVPEHLIGKEFRILHVHSEEDIQPIVPGEEAGVGTYVIDDEGYLVTKIDRLSEFVFMYQPDCGIHWVLIAVLVLFAAAFVVFTLVMKKKLLAFISCGVCGVATIVLAFFGGCSACTVFTVVNLVVIAAGVFYTALRE